MRTTAIRAKLNDYILIADDEKIKAMYVLFKNEINSELEWWKDNDLIWAFDSDYKKWKEGKMEGHSIEDVKASIKKLQLSSSSFANENGQVVRL